MCNQNHSFLQRQKFHYKYHPQPKKIPIFLAKVAPESVSLHRKVAPKSVWQSKKVAPKNVNMLIFSGLKKAKKVTSFSKNLRHILAYPLLFFAGKSYEQPMMLKMFHITITRCDLWYSKGKFPSKIIRNVDCGMDGLY